MNKWYFGLPLIALIAFLLFFLSWNRGYEQEKLERVRVEHEAFLKRQAYEQEQQRLAILENNKKVEANNARLRKEKEDAEAARVQREKWGEEYAKLSEDLRRISSKLLIVNKDIEAEKDLIARANEEKASLDAERAFLATYVKLAENNASRMLTLVDRVDKAAQTVKKKLDEIQAAAQPKKESR